MSARFSLIGIVVGSSLTGAHGRNGFGSHCPSAVRGSENNKSGRWACIDASEYGLRALLARCIRA